MLSTVLAKRDGKRMPTVMVENLPIDEAIGVSFTDHARPFYTRAKLTAYMGPHVATLRDGYRWNGADIPRICWSLLGVSPSDPRAIIASGFHDDGCERADIPQVIADATFVSLLRPFRFIDSGTHRGCYQPGVGPVRALAMYAAVRWYSICGRPIMRVKRKQNWLNFELAVALILDAITLAAAALVVYAVLQYLM